MLTAITLENFKRFGPSAHRHWIPLRPVTVLLGPNSSGKSTVIQALLAFAQSWRGSPNGIGNLTTAGPLIDLGTFANVFHRTSSSDGSHGVSIGLEQGDYRLVAEWDSDWRPGKHGPPAQGRLEQIELERLDPETRGVKARVIFVTSAIGEDGALELRTPSPDDRDVSRDTGLGSFLHDTQAPSKRPLVLHIADGDGGISATPAEASSLGEDAQPPSAEEVAFAHDVGRFVGARLSEFRDSLSSMSHIGPLRLRGHRIYHANRASRTWRVGRQGERLVDVVLGDPNALSEVNRYLGPEMLSLGHAAELLSVGISADAYELVLSDSKGIPDGGEAVRVGLPDVGSGVAQILPILVQLARARSRPRSKPGIVLSEQPELHLHPDIQGRLARVMADAAALQTDYTPCQMILETHSEHLVYGLGTMVRRGSLKAEDVVCNTFEPRSTGGAPDVKPIGFLNSGEFDGEFPRGFFPERERMERERYD